MQQILPRSCVRASPAPARDKRPRLTPPLSAPDPPCEHVILQPVRILLRQPSGILLPGLRRAGSALTASSFLPRPGHFSFSLPAQQRPGQPAAKKPEHRLVGKIIFDHLKGRADQLDKRMKKNISCLINKIRDPVLPENLRHIMSIPRNIARHQRDIAVTVSLFPHQFRNLLRRIPQLSGRVLKSGNTDIFHRAIPCFSRRAEQILLQKKQGGRAAVAHVLPRRQNYRLKNLCRNLSRHFKERSHHFFTHGEKLVEPAAVIKILPHIHRHRDSHPVRDLLPYQTVLQGRKPRKPVKYNHAAP